MQLNTSGPECEWSANGGPRRQYSTAPRAAVAGQTNHRLSSHSSWSALFALWDAPTDPHQSKSPASRIRDCFSTFLPSPQENGYAFRSVRLSVWCLSVCPRLDYSKSYERSLMKFSGGRAWPKEQVSRLWWRPDNDPNPEFFKGYT